MNHLYYGDNLQILRKKIKDDTVDLCYIDPPFNSKRNYNQIYNNVGAEDRAQAQAFTDTWKWDDLANEGFSEILANAEGRFQPQLVDLIKGLHPVLKQGSLFAYLISIALRVTEIQRVLKTTGSFYLHCDPTASHYLKLVLDAVFCTRGGDFINEIDWCYKSGGASKRHFSRKHDVLLFYAKSKDYVFNCQREKSYNRGLKPYRFDGVEEFKDEIGWYTLVGMKDYWNIDMVGRTSAERLGYPTQKPEALLERIITASTNEGDVVMDAYCGCGTTVAVAQRMKRQWLGIDITYQSVSLVMRRLEKAFGCKVLDKISLDGIPRDMASAEALAHKKDDRLRKEFEKWVLLTYTNNRASINEKKGADAGIDGVAYFETRGVASESANAKIVFQVKSGKVDRGDVATLRGDMEREGAALAVLITLEEPTRPMIAEAKKAGQYHHQTMGHNYDKISIVTVKDIVEKSKRLEIPMSLEVVTDAKRAVEDKQIELDLG